MLIGVTSCRAVKRAKELCHGRQVNDPPQHLAMSSSRILHNNRGMGCFMQVTNTQTFLHTTRWGLEWNQSTAEAHGTSHAAGPKRDDYLKAAHAAEACKRATLALEHCRQRTPTRVHPSQEVRPNCGQPERRQHKSTYNRIDLRLNGRGQGSEELR
jgi:hypothetical protein